MNMNPTPDWSRPQRWHRARTEGNPVPGWARVLAVVLVFGGYGLLTTRRAGELMNSVGVPFEVACRVLPKRSPCQ